jgi:hypothetical protein
MCLRFEKICGSGQLEKRLLEVWSASLCEQSGNGIERNERALMDDRHPMRELFDFRERVRGKEQRGLRIAQNDG